MNQKFVKICLISSSFNLYKFIAIYNLQVYMSLHVYKRYRM